MTTPYIRLKNGQMKVLESPARFRILVAGRRFGKTYLAMVELCRAAWKRGALVWYVAPTYRQAKRIVWKPLKEMTRPYWASKPNETDLRIDLITGGSIALRGADNYDSLRGDGLDFVILDEYASMDPDAWTQVLRPALADRLGRALFIGTPKGHNHFYDLYRDSRDQPGWARFQYTTAQGGIVSREELERATHELDERVYKQEFEGRFETFTEGLVYYAFDHQGCVKERPYDPNLPLNWSLDFNVKPAASILAQRNGDYIHVLDEIYIPEASTWDACEAFYARSEKWLPARGRLEVRIFGDATADRDQSSASRTDWQIVHEFFKRNEDRYDSTFRVNTGNPRVKDRVNCVNAKLKSYAGDRYVRIHPQCKELIEDLERVHWKEDTAGNVLWKLDGSDKKRTHTSDAFGYMIATEFPMKAESGPRPGSLF